MRAMLVALLVLVACESRPAVQDVRVVAIPVEHRETLAERWDRTTTEDAFEKALSFKCSQEWRSEQRAKFGDSWLSAACRTEIAKARQNQ